MKFIFTLLILGIFLSLLGCGSKKEEQVILDSRDLESQMTEAYNKGLKALEDGDVLFAAKNFNIWQLVDSIFFFWKIFYKII